MKTKEQIINEYAVKLGFEDWKHLMYDFAEEFDIEGLQFHINAVTDLIQKELLSKVAYETNLKAFLTSDHEYNTNEILNTPIL